MRVRLVSLLAALLAVSVAVSAPVPKPKPKKEVPKQFTVKDLEGAWSVVSYEYKTARGVNTSILYEKVEIKDANWVQKRTLPNGRTAQTVPYAITIDTSKSPSVFDMEYARALPKGAIAAAATTKRLGAFRLEGDKLTVTYILGNRDRPASVDGDLAVSQYRWVLRREKR